MSTLQALVRVLRQSLWIMLLRRFIAWGACVLLLLVLGNLLAGFFGNERVLRLGLFLTGFSCLPAFLVWPLPEQRLLERFRRIDEDMVFEAYLEAGPGPARVLLQTLAAEKAAALPFRELPREGRLDGLRLLCGGAILCLVLGEGVSFLVRGHSLLLAQESPAAAENGQRIEERGFSDFATEDPAARHTRRERALERTGQETTPGEASRLGAVHATGQGTASSRRAPRAYDEPGDIPGSSASRQKQGEGEEAGTSDGPAPASPGAGPGGEKGQKPGTAGSQAAGTMPSGAQGREPQGQPAAPGHTGQGYEHTGDTKVPSPLLDYRARFEERYAERGGKRLAASGRMGFGELRAYQRRYFASFTLRVEVGRAEDPRVALLKRRWSERKGGVW